MTDNEDSNEPEIHVDEDWKQQVENEKEALKNAVEAGGGEDSDEAGELPPASFLGMLSMLGSQAMSALGVIPDFSTGEPNVNRPLAKHCIDMIGVLQDKTKNNLSDDEAAHIRDALHQLRMIYVSTAGTAGQPPNDPGPSIELP